MKISLNLKEDSKFKIKLRVPVWCTTYTATASGKKYVGTPGTFLEIERKWKNGDEINIDFDIPVNVVEDKSYKGFVAVKRGPQIMAVDGFLNNEVENLDEISVNIQKPAKLEAVAQSDIPKEWWGKQIYTCSALKPTDLKLVPYAEVGQIHHTDYHTLLRIDDGWKTADNDALSYQGSGWQVENNQSHFGGSVHQTKNEGDYAEFIFTGTGVELYTCSYLSPFFNTLDSTCLADIYLDGEYQGEFTLQAQHMQWQMFKKDNLKEGKHTLKIENKKYYAYIDYVRYK